MSTTPNPQAPDLRAVIFDYGLVLCGPPEPAAHARLLEITGLPYDEFEQYYWKYRLDYDRATLDGPAYWRAIARDAGKTFQKDQIDALIEQDVLLWATVDPIMLDWVGRVRAAGLKTAILSNMGADLLRYMRANFRWLEPFDQLTWSCEIRATKPDAAIYRHTLERLGVRPDEALFLDDKAENVEGAQRVGIHALQFRDPESLQSDLHRNGWLRQLPPVLASDNAEAKIAAQDITLRTAKRTKS